ncbi:hypothetical protein EDC01DRAFT_612426 [Geopyxis carbonaria]|nr:hypothetical protein EDC01DRAFT_612426 [Geopyxis carbonaria]
MPLPVPSPASRFNRSSLPTPSKKRPSSAASQTTSTTTSQRQSSASPSRLTQPSPTFMSRPSTRMSSEIDQANDDAARMPPPPLPGVRRTVSVRSSASSMKDAPVPEKKTSALGRAGSVLRRAAGVRSLKDKEEDKAKASSRILRSNSNATGSTTSSVPTKKPESEKGVFGLGRLRSSKSAADKAAAEKKSLASRLGSVAKPTGVPQRTNTTTAKRTSPTGSATSSSSASGPTKRVGGPATSNVPKGHRRNSSTPSAGIPGLKDPRPVTASSMKGRRPAFTTLEQDFHGRTRPPIRSRGMPPPPLDTATIHSQTQLMQYTCLYASSHATYAQLTESATAKLKNRFGNLSDQHRRSRERLVKKQKTHNISGLAAVVEAPAAGITSRRRDTMRSAEEKIQAFSEAIKKLETLQQNEHRLMSLGFGEWIAGYSPPSPSFGVEEEGWVRRRGRWIDGLGEDWRRECLFIARRIEACVSAIQAIVAASVSVEDANSVVAIVAERWLEVARGMLEEVQGMWQVEERVVGRERMALEDVVASASAATVQFHGRVGEVGGIWSRC